jgi:hypothetical protein
LADFDRNSDGFVDAQDAQFTELSVWQDSNGNHQTDAGELVSLKAVGLLRIATNYTEVPILDAQGNLHLERSSADLANGRVVEVSDIYLAVSVEDAQQAGVSLPSITALMDFKTPSVSLLG